jgi:hypothetical protein
MPTPVLETEPQDEGAPVGDLPLQERSGASATDASFSDQVQAAHALLLAAGYVAASPRPNRRG